jgi:hypothetical protein
VQRCERTPFCGSKCKQYRQLDFLAFGKSVKQKRVLDGRNALERAGAG